MDLLHALAGAVLLVALSWALSEKRSQVQWRVVVSGLALTVVPRRGAAPRRTPSKRGLFGE
jgi:nucleoside permease NupC